MNHHTLQEGDPVPPNATLETLYGRGGHSFSRAKAALAHTDSPDADQPSGTLQDALEGFLQASPHTGTVDRQYVFAQVPTDTTLNRHLISRLRQEDTHAIELLEHTSNTDRDADWQGNDAVQRKLTFKPEQHQEARGAVTSSLISHLNKAPIPLIEKTRQHSPAPASETANAASTSRHCIRYTPQIDFTQLQATVSAMVKNNTLLASWVLTNSRLWQLPALYESQLGFKPALRLKRLPNRSLSRKAPKRYTISGGLKPLGHRRPFIALADIPTSPLTQRSPFDLQRYSQTTLARVQALLPIPKLATLSTSSQPIELNETQYNAFVQLAEPLSNLGYSVTLPRR
ncbi:MAG: hypothetical protein R2857_15635 [Vampirovibrionales bacterium]